MLAKLSLSSQPKNMALQCDYFLKTICDVLCDLVAFAQFKKREKHPWKTVTLSKVAD